MILNVTGHFSQHYATRVSLFQRAWSANAPAITVTSPAPLSTSGHLDPELTQSVRFSWKDIGYVTCVKRRGYSASVSLTTFIVHVKQEGV
ncbi:hypothetical protein GJAV_G00106710 [Gymnothorax javanicus]|nr:hypothetical protein GJAV_G00106710 [Gymnothorax javanicus]